MAEKRRVGKAKKCKFVIPEKGTKHGNFCGMPLTADGKCPQHGSKVK